MSLVNDMLRDLEQRSARVGEPLAGVGPAAQTPEARSSRSVATAGILVLAAAGALSGLKWSLPAGEIPVATVQTPAQPVASAVLPDEPAVATLASLRRYRLDYRLASRPAPQPVSPAAADRAPLAKEPPPVGNTELATVEPETVPGNGIQPATAAAEAAARTRVTRTRVDPASRLRNDGLSALKRGRPAEAERQFRELVALAPSRTDSHLLLHRALVAQSRGAQAQAELSGALEVSDEPARVAQVLAHSLISAGDSLAAQVLLERHRGARGADLEYVALLAAVYERNGDYRQAADHYLYLVSQKPGQGAWWIGLAIATDALGRRAEAREAFERASHSRGLDPALAHYANQRLESLGAAP